MKEYITSETPTFGKLIEAIQELTESGVIKWRNRVDKDCPTLQLSITGEMRSPQYNRGAVCIEVGVYHTNQGQKTRIKMPNYSASIVAGDEADKLNKFLETYPVDTDETDVVALLANSLLTKK